MGSSLFDLTGKAALVTGGNSGIGLGFAEGMAEAGADVCIWGTNESKNEVAAETLRQYGNKVLALRCDVGDPEQVKESFEKTTAEFGRLDSCFANAGVGGRGTPFGKMSLEEWRDVFRVNMEGVFFTFQAAANYMVEQGQGGSLVVTSSASYISGAPRSEHYAATKGGVISMMRGLSVEYGRKGIRANAVVPGWIDTAMTERAMNNQAFIDKVQSRIPAGRWGDPADFKGIAVYLTSDASSYHSGDVFVIDGAYLQF